MKFAGRVYQILRKVPKGRVTTYKAIAQKLGCRAYQAVGQALKNNPYAPRVPCHRVVKSNGNISGFMGKTDKNSVDKKIKLLESEGVRVVKNKVMDFEKVIF